MSFTNAKKVWEKRAFYRLELRPGATIVQSWLTSANAIAASRERRGYQQRDVLADSVQETRGEWERQ